MKAWQVNESSYEFCTIVFAETANKAKLRGSNALDVPYIDVRVKRANWADNLAQKGGEIDWDNKEVAQILRDQGWWYIEEKRCIECGLSEWDILTHSHLVDDVCGDCKEKINNEISY